VLTLIEEMPNPLLHCPADDELLRLLEGLRCDYAQRSHPPFAEDQSARAYSRMSIAIRLRVTPFLTIE
jgi:hypothetical protein